MVSCDKPRSSTGRFDDVRSLVAAAPIIADVVAAEVVLATIADWEGPTARLARVWVRLRFDYAYHSPGSWPMRPLMLLTLLAIRSPRVSVKANSSEELKVK